MEIKPQPSPPHKIGQISKSGHLAQAFGCCVSKKKKLFSLSGVAL